MGYAGDRAGRDGVLLACQLAELTGAELTVVFPYHPLFATVTGDVAEAQTHSELKALRGDDPVLARARFRWNPSAPRSATTLPASWRTGSTSPFISAFWTTAW